MSKSENFALFHKAIEKFVAENNVKYNNSDSYSAGYLMSMMQTMFKDLSQKKQKEYLEQILFHKHSV